MPSFSFSSSSDYRYEPGKIFLGLDPETGREVGIHLEKHGLVVASTRMGKGAGFIVPNLRRWPDSVCVVDPKGENFVLSWKERQAMGQTIALIDPFRVAGVPAGELAQAGVKTCFNPLAGIGPATPRARERIKAIANALVTSHDDKHAEWTEGARTIIAGACAYVAAHGDPETINLASVRAMFLTDPERRRKIASAMMETPEFGGLATAAGSIILDALDKGTGIAPQLWEKARGATSWLDSPELAGVLERSDFALTDLTGNKLSVYLVLTSDDIEEYAGFLRLFIQTMLYGVTQAGIGQQTNCLFILDEFFSLGKFDKISEVMGRMAGYGVHVVPVVQNMGQLEQLYGYSGKETFSANAEFRMFFGDNVQDADRISQEIGRFTIDEVALNRPVEPKFLDGSPKSARMLYVKNPDGSYKRRGLPWNRHYVNSWHDEVKDAIEYREKLAEYQKSMSWAGKPRLPATDIVAMTGKGVGDKVAKSAIVFVKAGDVLKVKLAPYFNEKTEKQKTAGKIKTEMQRELDDNIKWHRDIEDKRTKWIIALMWGCWFISALGLFILLMNAAACWYRTTSYHGYDYAELLWYGLPTIAGFTILTTIVCFSGLFYCSTKADEGIKRDRETIRDQFSPA